MKKLAVYLAVAIALGATNAQAYTTGDMILRAGVTTVAPDESSSNVFIGSTDVGVGVNVDNNTQLGLNFAYFLSPNWAIEVLAATPFEHDIGLDTVGALGSTKHLPPTISANYHFLDADSAFQPYVGLGVNYTIFFSEDFTAANQEAGFSDLELDDSVGLSAQIGFDYMLDDNWFVNASARYIDISTEATFTNNGTAGTVDVDIDPFVYSLTVGYKF
ncbi:MULTISPECIES: OmpW/AlkL family protein [Alteromonadaceae]|uniref:OmpW/AlkL family protein n=1 Tax=Alteromonadaceae TaxID=72275 RepID=UPI001C085126|nr:MULTISPECIES: OmpW family outer membrane protein [Aliiglaciecola]MBU2877573.1 outer membrane beta-barrel protein [Aliiglaciecola lipolytica]MDO6711153.1 OmpW family outer membrane protein [Aliiglaciecola sp. 2_MG-2023]MDO6752067.1 OmpW family outer membrane protein [Aliiglaciecola sp. 1_MG-2023]